MKALLGVSRAIDAVNETIGRALIWLVLVMTLVSAGNAIARYGFNLSSNAWVEAQWYMFSIIFLLGAGWTLKHNAHVRIDLISGRLSKRGQAGIDIFGTVFMMLPACAIIFWFGWQAAMESFRVQEVSGDAGGLSRWPIKFVIPIGFALLILQGLSELIKRIAFLKGLIEIEEVKHGELEDALKMMSVDGKGMIDVAAGRDSKQGR